MRNDMILHRLLTVGRRCWLPAALFLSLLMMVGPVRAQGQRYVIDIYSKGENIRKLTVAVPDFQPLGASQSSPEMGERLAKWMAGDLDITGMFIPLEKEVYLESDHMAGIDPNKPLNFNEWKAVAADFVIKGGYELSGDQLVLELRLFDSALQKMELGKRYDARAEDGYRMVNRFANEILRYLTGIPGCFGSKILYSQGAGTDREIFMTEFRGPEVVQMTKGAGPSRMPSVSPVGDIVYVTRSGNQYQLVLNRQVVGKGPLFLSPGFTPDNSLLAAISNANDTNIYYFPPGGKPVPLTKHWGINISPTVSPDGQYMAFVSDRAGGAQIYIQPLNGGDVRRLTTQGTKNTDPQWSPRGDRIVFVGEEKNIYSINPDGSGLMQLTAGSGTNTRPSWSPDGRLISFESTRNGRSQLFVMTANGERQLPIMPEHKANQRSPFWSPQKLE